MLGTATATVALKSGCVGNGVELACTTTDALSMMHQVFALPFVNILLPKMVSRQIFLTLAVACDHVRVFFGKTYTAAFFAVQFLRRGRQMAVQSEHFCIKSVLWPGSTAAVAWHHIRIEGTPSENLPAFKTT